MSIFSNVSNTVAMTVAGAAIAGVLGLSGVIALKDRKINALEAQITNQKIVNAAEFRAIIERYNNANTGPITDDDVDCILRGLAGTPRETENCGPL